MNQPEIKKFRKITFFESFWFTKIKTKTANKEEHNSTPPTDKGKEENNKPKSNKWSNVFEKLKFWDN